MQVSPALVLKAFGQWMSTVRLLQNPARLATRQTDALQQLSAQHNALMRCTLSRLSRLSTVIFVHRLGSSHLGWYGTPSNPSFEAGSYRPSI